jgi:hypothetical protein
MNKFAILGVALSLLVSAGGAVAADTADSPAGLWKWSGKVGKKDADFSLKLDYKDGKVTGSLAGGKLDLKIEEGTFKDGELTFTATGESKGEKVSFKGTGKLTGDTLKGKLTGERNGKTKTDDFEAKREKAEKKKD